MVKCEFLSKIDLFTYLPVPHTYPISTTKSKMASLIFISFIIIFFIYDFVMFVLYNTPVINTYTSSTQNQAYKLPDVAFGFFYGQDLDRVLNDESYFTYKFQTIETQYSNGSLSSQKTTVDLQNNCNFSWLQAYSAFYHNFSCIGKDLNIMNPPLKRKQSITQRLVISLCKDNGTNNCRSQKQVFEMLAGGRLFFFVNQPQGFNYKAGEIIESEYPFEILVFFLVPGIYNRITIQFQNSFFTLYPDYLTRFSPYSLSYMKSKPPQSAISNVTVYNKQIMLAINLEISAEQHHFSIHFQTSLEHISLWGAMVSVGFTLFAICVLTYNKRKFLRKNPEWGQFDQTLRKKFELQMKTKKQFDQESGISHIRREIERESKNY